MRRGLKRPLHTAKSPGRKRGPAEPAPHPRTTGGRDTLYMKSQNLVKKSDSAPSN